MKLFCTAEIFILPAALFVAILRSLPGPVFFPLRALAIVYADLFRGIPTILVISILGFGMPALGLSWMPSSQFFWAVVALVLVYTAYVSEVYRSGIESVHPSQAAAARSLGLSHLQALRFVVVPQAVRRVIPPLLNDFIGLQKDTALVGTLGVVEAFKQAQIDQSATFNGTPYLVAATLFVLITIPLARFTDWLDRARPAPAAGGEAGVSARPAALQVEGPAQVLRQARGAARDRPRGRRARGRLPDRRLGLRQVDAAPLHQPARAHPGGPDRRRRGRDHGAERRRRRDPAPDRDRLPVVQPLPAHDASSRTSRSARGRRSSNRGARPRRAAVALLERFGLADKRDEYPDRLSGGQQQRVAIVRALAMKPELLLLDEVTSALDPELVAEVLDVIRELAAGGMTMVIATHEMGFARDIASRVCFLDAGVILEQGTPEQIFSAPREERTRQFLQRIVDAGRL